MGAVRRPSGKGGTALHIFQCFRQSEATLCSNNRLHVPHADTDGHRLTGLPGGIGNGQDVFGEGRSRDMNGLVAVRGIGNECDVSKVASVILRTVFNRQGALLSGCDGHRHRADLKQSRTALDF